MWTLPWLADHISEAEVQRREVGRSMLHGKQMSQGLLMHDAEGQRVPWVSQRPKLDLSVFIHLPVIKGTQKTHKNGKMNLFTI